MFYYIEFILEKNIYSIFYKFIVIQKLTGKKKKKKKYKNKKKKKKKRQKKKKNKKKFKKKNIKNIKKIKKNKEYKKDTHKKNICYSKMNFTHYRLQIINKQKKQNLKN